MNYTSVGMKTAIKVIWFSFLFCHQLNAAVVTLRKVTVAKTQQDREIGFMKQDSIQDDEGMLFIFPESRKHCFWMKNTLVPLDVLLVNEDYRVIDVIYNMEPQSKVKRCFTKRGLRAIEIKARSQRNRVKVDEKVIIRADIED